MSQCSIPRSRSKIYSPIVSALRMITVVAIAAVQVRIGFVNVFRDKSDKAPPQSNIAVAMFGFIGSAPGMIDLSAST